MARPPPPRPPRTRAFDAYLAVDWSAAGRPVTGPHSLWWALLRAGGGRAGGGRVRTENPPTRAEGMAALLALLTGPLAHARVLVGFDFSFGFPSGLAAALGHGGRPEGAWQAVWRDLAARVEDGADNRNNRFAVAAAYNALLTGGEGGPFYGRPPGVPEAVARALPPRRVGVFDYPVRTRQGPVLSRLRRAEVHARAASPSWFVYGGAQSVGGQVLLGVPRVHALRARLGAEAAVWPFETGPRLPGPGGPRVVLAEVYPSLFHRRAPASAGVHDALQVEAAVRHFARADADGGLARLFAAPAPYPEALHEEGWVLGAE